MKKITLAALTLVLAIGIGLGVTEYRKATVDLKGKCFVVNAGNGMLVQLMILDENKNNYLIMASNGMITIPMEAPKKEVRKSYHNGEMKEFDCETGVPKDE